MTTRDPAAQLRDASEGLLAGKATLGGLLRSAPRTWLVFPVAIAGWDATRGLTASLVLAVIVVPLVLGFLGQASLEATQPSPRLPPASLWLAIALAVVIGAAVLALVGAGPSAAALLVVAAIVSAWRGLVRPRLRGGDRERGLARAAAVVQAGEDALVLAVLGGAAGLAGTLLEPSGERSAWVWPVAYAGWLAGRLAVDRAAVSGPGTRPLGWLVAAGHVVAIVLAATQGPLGVLLAAGLLPGLLLGVMVLTGRPARAAGEARVLDRLLAIWTAVLLLVAWRLLVIDPWLTAVIVTAAATGYLLVAIILVRLTTRRRRPRDADAATLVDPSLVIVLPLTGPVPELRQLVLALRAQTYADTRVLVAALPDVEVEVAAEWLGEDAILAVGSPPPGWAPAAWARHAALVDPATDAELALVVDARTVLAPVAARVLVEHTRATRVDAIGAIPRNALPTPADRLAGSGPTLWRFGWEPRWWVALTRGRPARLVGPDAALVLVRIPAYRAATERRGSVPVAPDGVLRLIADDGRRIGLVHAADLATRRGERRLAGALRWWREHAVRLAGGTLGDAVSMLLLVLLGWVAPLVLPLLAIVVGAPTGVVAVAVIPLALLALARLALAATQRGSVQAIAWHPMMAAVAVVGILLGVLDAARGEHPEGAPDAASTAPAAEPVVSSRT